MYDYVSLIDIVMLSFDISFDVVMLPFDVVELPFDVINIYMTAPHKLSRKSALCSHNNYRGIGVVSTMKPLSSSEHVVLSEIANENMITVCL